MPPLVHALITSTWSKIWPGNVRSTPPFWASQWVFCELGVILRELYSIIHRLHVLFLTRSSFKTALILSMHHDSGLNSEKNRSLRYYTARSEFAWVSTLQITHQLVLQWERIAWGRLRLRSDKWPLNGWAYETNTVATIVCWYGVKDRPMGIDLHGWIIWKRILGEIEIEWENHPSKKESFDFQSRVSSVMMSLVSATKRNKGLYT